MIRYAASRIALACALATGVAASPAFAQSAEGAPDNQTEGDDIVVTGRAGTTDQKKVDTSYAISTVSSQELQMRSPLGVVEALKQVPGFFITNTSGEASSGVSVRGIPSDGFQSVALLEDGIPVQSDPGLGWLNGDQSMRVDQTIDRIEVVRGGPSSIFYSNAPGAAINFITRKGGDHMQGMVRYEAADWGSHRVDAWVSGPIGNSDWRFFAGGYYRIDQGKRDPGFRQGQGGQFRVNISRDFDHGSVSFGVKRIDERIPNWGGGIYTTDKDGNPIGVNGFNPRQDTIESSDNRRFTFKTGRGAYAFDDGIGTTVKLTQLSFTGKRELSDNVRVEENVRYRESYTRRDSVTPYKIFASGKDFLSSTFGAALAPGLGLFYRDTGAAFAANQNGNGLPLIDLARSHVVPLDEVISDTKLLAKADFLGHHDLAFGVYYAHAKEGYRADSAAVLTDVRDNAQVLDVSLLGPGGTRGANLTDGGVLQYGAEFANGTGKSDNIAVYASDEWQITPKLRLDAGLRWEQIKTSGQVEGTQSLNLKLLNPGIADDKVLSGTGKFTPFDRTFDHMSWTAGVNYQFLPDFGAFVRYTDAFRLPNISSFITNPTSQPVVQTMNFAEAGLKFSRRHFSVYLTGFRTQYNSFEIADVRQDANGALVPFRVFGDTRTWGTELEATWRPVQWFDLHGAWTWQDARYTNFVFNQQAVDAAGKPVVDANGKPVLKKVDYSNNRQNPLPHNSFRITPAINLFNQAFRVETDVNYIGQRFTDVANQISLQPMWTMDLTARYQVTPQLQLNLIVNNLTDTLGLVNGNPRAGTINNTEAGQAIFIGSSQYRRSFRGAITYRF